MTVRRISVTAALVAGAALVLSACGGNTSATSTSSAASSSSSSSAALTGIAAQGADAGKAAGAPLALKKLKIGYVDYAKATLAAARVEVAAGVAAAKLGWDFVPCDGQANPTVMAKCATNLVNQGVDALILNVIPQAAVVDALKSAQAKGIPVIQVGGDPGQKDLETAAYFPSESDMGSTLGGWVVTTLGADSKAQLIVQGFPAPFATQRNDALKATIKPTTITVAAEYDVDAANLIANTASQTTALINQHPDAKLVWTVFSGADLGASQALDTKFPGKSYPDRPAIVTFYANLPTIDLIRQGKVQAAVENSLEWTAWVAMDQIAEFEARKTPISTDPRPNYGAGLDFWKNVVVDKTNLPAEGQLLTPPVDYREFFNAKWKTEFTNVTG